MPTVNVPAAAGITQAELIVTGAVNVLNLRGNPVSVVEDVVPQIVDVGERPTVELLPVTDAPT